MTANADQLFEAIYRDYSRQITAHIARRLYRADPQLAEDLAAETFLRLWRSLVAGLNVEHPRALLTTIAERTIVDHFRRASSRETATDFTAGVLQAVAGNADSPHLAGLLDELEDAKELLAVAADTYRDLNRKWVIAHAAYVNAVQPDVLNRATVRSYRARMFRDRALKEFAAAGRAVALARAAWNTNAGELHGLVAASRTAAVGAVTR